MASLVNDSQPIQQPAAAASIPAPAAANGHTRESSVDSVSQKNSDSRQIKKRRKKKKQANKQQSNEAASDADIDKDEEPDVEIEYVTKAPSLDFIANAMDTTESEAPADLVAIKEFEKIFKHFQLSDSETGEEPKPTDSVKKSDAVKSEDGVAKKMHDSDSDAGSGSDDEDKLKEGGVSKKKLRKLNRLSVAELKQLVKKPEVVEWVDVTAADPKLLVSLKAYRNTVPVPKHWSQKRKYLQGKRGIEKPPWDLPEFIKDTGIMQMREAVKEKEDAAKLKTKTRERLQPKMGKLDIDYQKLHDAFFRFQTRPRLTIHGELYYEGKEFETKLKEKKPGSLSEELKIALNIPPLAPPPWLINMQYHGPPPSYPNLKIPGLNAPIPDGAHWGYHPGGWGRPPVDEYNRPLYGDVFGVMGQDVVPPEIVQPIERKLWGELESEEEESESEEESEEGSEAEAEATAEDATLKEGLVTPSGLASVASTVPSGLETPDFIELRKDPRTRGGDDGGGDENQRQLYTVIPEVQRSITGFMGSQHGYDLSAAKAPVAGTKRKIVGEGVEISLDASELEGLDEETLRRKFEEQQAAVAVGEGMAAPNKEDFSDMVAEHANKQAKKRKKIEEGKKDGKKSKEFKF